ncbi:ATP-binding protein [Bradyrhizobium sp. 17]|uniref:ATP-binding protein n=1 Tax=Bradyrhizobium sp. 17 TaxID=2782649 RepID=UPI001FF8CBCD|nr:ATP-binding protein [Bradyrhizobium sp. 17]MCK1522796.1 AAA family ATPase [Bradyrhizobium sp. 17]
MSGWYLQRVSIEGFRGINNEGAPLVLKLKPDCVNSISAPNGVGKTSIFDAIVYAITGRTPKLEDLPAAEKGPSYSDVPSQAHNARFPISTRLIVKFLHR